MTRIGIFGVSGRMGQAIAAVAATADVSIIALDAGDFATLADRPDVLVDFSVPAALESHLAAARRTHTPILIGTTGLNDAHHAMIDDAAREIAVLQAANTSLGIALVASLVAQAVSRLGSDWDVEILEMHHRRKVDAPSGTALMLGQVAAGVRGKSLPELTRFDRNDAREEGTIGFASLRGGSVAGDHLVVLAAEGERIEIGHRAESRVIFARGAVKGALWLAGRRAGRYTMGDVLGLAPL